VKETVGRLHTVGIAITPFGRNVVSQRQQTTFIDLISTSGRRGIGQRQEVR